MRKILLILMSIILNSSPNFKYFTTKEIIKIYEENRIRENYNYIFALKFSGLFWRKKKTKQDN